MLRAFVHKAQKKGKEKNMTKKNMHMLPSAALVDGWAGTPFIDTTPSCFTRPSVMANAHLLVTYTHTHARTHAAAAAAECCPMFPPSCGDLHPVTSGSQSRPFNSETSARMHFNKDTRIFRDENATRLPGGGKWRRFLFCFFLCI